MFEIFCHFSNTISKLILQKVFNSKPQRLKIKANRKRSFPFEGMVETVLKTQSYTAAKNACSTHLRTVSFDTKHEFLLFSEKGKPSMTRQRRKDPEKPILCTLCTLPSPAKCSHSHCCWKMHNTFSLSRLASQLS